MKTVTLHEIGYTAGKRIKNLADGEWVVPLVRREAPVVREFTDVSIESMQEIDGVSFGRLAIVDAKQTFIGRILNKMPREIVGKDPEKVRYTRITTVSGQCLDVSESIDEIKKALA